MQGMRQTKNPGLAKLVILGMLLLRALVPAGFMLGPVDGHLAFVLCDSEMPVLRNAGHRMHDHAAHSHGAHGDPTCPYAQSAGPAPLPTLPALAGGPAVALLMEARAFTQTHVGFGPLRQHLARGPPHFA